MRRILRWLSLSGIGRPVPEAWEEDIAFANGIKYSVSKIDGEEIWRASSSATSLPKSGRVHDARAVCQNHADQQSSRLDPEGSGFMCRSQVELELAMFCAYSIGRKTSPHICDGSDRIISAEEYSWACEYLSDIIANVSPSFESSVRDKVRQIFIESKYGLEFDPNRRWHIRLVELEVLVELFLKKWAPLPISEFASSWDQAWSEYREILDSASPFDQGHVKDMLVPLFSRIP